VGVLFVFGIKFRRELPEGFKRVFGTGMLPIIFINLFIGFVGRDFIGNSAHLGGLFAGAALAVFVDYRRPNARVRRQHRLASYSGAVAGGSCVGVFTRSRETSIVRDRWSARRERNALIF
jgi:hypothetical protein